MRAKGIARIPNCARACFCVAQRQFVISNICMRPALPYRTRHIRQISTNNSSRSNTSASHHDFPSSNNPSVWFERFQRAIPSSFHHQSGENNDPHNLESPPQFQISDLVEVVHSSRMRNNIDILSYCGVHMYKWTEMRNSFISLIDFAKNRVGTPSISTMLSAIKWPEQMILKDLTQRGFTPLGVASSQKQASVADRIAASPTLSGHYVSSGRSAKDVIGNVWISLGNLMIEAGNRNRSESDLILSHTLPVLCHLQLQGFIPEAICSSHANKDPSALKQPEALGEIFPQMYELLSNISSKAPWPLEALDPSLRKFEGNSLDVLDETALSDDLSTFPPHMWLEFILWCCVHGRLIMEGASIVQGLSKPGANRLWRLVDWHGSSNPIESERQISARAVATLIDGLVSLPIIAGSGTQHYSMPLILGKIAALKKLLVRNNMSLGSSTWDAIIARFIDNPALMSMEGNPVLMEEALELAEVFGNEVNYQNVQGPKEADSMRDAAIYIFDGSAAVIGFYHRILRAFVRSRDISGALRVLKRLQAFTDTNKKKSLEQFFSRLRNFNSQPGLTTQIQRQSTANEIQKAFPEIEYPSYFLEVPVSVLADLLDLVTDSENFEFGKWMVYSDDVDGPMISPNIFGDQNIAPSLIRFAARTGDKKLLSSVIEMQTVDVSGETLLALCESRIQHGDINGALEILYLLRKHSSQMWTIKDISKLAKSLVGQIYGQPANKDLGSISSKMAAELLQMILRGDVGQDWDISFTQVDSLIAILSSLDAHLNSLCSTLPVLSQQHKIDLPTSSFNEILQAVTKIWGSRKGMTVLEYWCMKSTERHIPDRNRLTGSEPRLDVARLFSVDAPTELDRTEDPASEFVQFHGAITPDIFTIRIVIQDALEEAGLLVSGAAEQYESFTNDSDGHDSISSQPKHEILDWAANVLREKFGLAESAIDYELHGYLSSLSQTTGEPADVTYSGNTLRIWDAFIGPRKLWALSMEERLRLFISNKNEKQVLFEPEPAMERALLHSLARDYGLASESPPGDEPERQVKVYKNSSTSPNLPPATVDEARVGSMRAA